jgi:hypothetical protein
LLDLNREKIYEEFKKKKKFKEEEVYKEEGYKES